MKDQVVFFAKVGAKATLGFAGILAAGLAVCIVSFAASLYFIGNTPGAGYAGAGAGGVGAILGLLVLFRAEPASAALLVASLGGVVVYALLAQRHALQTAISAVWREKGAGLVLPRVEAYLRRIGERQPGWMKSAAGRASLRTRLLEALREDGSLGSIPRRILRYGFRKLNLDGLGLEDPALDLPRALTARVEAKLAEVTAPSLVLFWIVSGAMVGLLALAVVLDKHA